MLVDMGVVLEILDGDQKGEQVAVREGLTIGRKDNDLNLRDPKISSKHARVEFRDGNPWLVDLGSANGIKAEGKKLTELPLLAGTEFRLGRVRIAVIKDGLRDVNRDGIIDFDADSTRPAVQAEPVKQKTWLDVLEKLTEKARTASEKPREVEPFEAILKMNFKKGPQMGTQWMLGYGPRDVGASSTDLPIFETGAPDQCFRLIPKADGTIVKISENAVGKVLVNGRKVDTAFIKSGDVIDIGDTRIEILFEAHRS